MTPSRPASREPLRAMLHGGLLVSMLAAPVAVVLAWATRGEAGGLGAVAGSALVIGFFSLGLLAMRYVLERMPAATAMAGALAVYLFQLTLLALAIALLSTVDALDGRSLALSTIGLGLAWMTGQVWGFSRARTPVFDVPLPQAGAR